MAARDGQNLLSFLVGTNHGSATCWLAGRPVISFRSGSPSEPLVERGLSAHVVISGRRFSNDVLLKPRQSAAAVFERSNWCTRRPTQVLVTFASGGKPIAAAVRGGFAALTEAGRAKLRLV